MLSRKIIGLLGCICLIHFSLQGQIRKSNFGIYGGTTLSSFHRSSEFPINPLTENDLQGYEVGLHLPLVNGRTYEFKIYLSYFQFGGKETFNLNDNNYRTTLKFNALKASVLPIVLKFGWQKLKFSLGGGGYYTYALNQDFRSTPALAVNFPEKLFDKFTYGGQGQVGIHFNRFILNLNAYNSLSNLVVSDRDETKNIQTRGTSATLTIMLGKQLEKPVVENISNE